MKKLKLLALAVVVLATYNCKETKKEKEAQTQEAMATDMFSLVNDSTKVSFTAYKTSEKLPVGGTFTKIEITNSNGGASMLEALDGTAFSIPVSSLFTNDATGTRDPKLLEFFFGVMKNTSLISGTFKTAADNSCSIDVTLNGETSNIPLKHTITSENTMTFDGVMNLEHWKALEAIASINDACKELHTGKDGVPKTWSEVAVQARAYFQKK